VIQGFLHGAAPTPTNGQVLDTLIAVYPAQIRDIIASATAGGTTATLDVTNNGVSVWTNAANRPTLAAAGGGRFVCGAVNRRAVRIGDVLQLLVPTAGGKTNLLASVALEDP
jgi:hypothetical protein